MSDPLSIQHQLEALIPEIVRRWEDRVRATVLPAQHQSSPALIDSLPDFLQELAYTLAAGETLGAEQAKTTLSREHGRQRASLVGYSLDQILREYCLLRSVVLEVLEEAGPIPPGPRDHILSSIEVAMRLTSVEFVRVQQDALHEADIRKNTFLHTLAHELRTPLSAITNATYVLQQIGSDEPGAVRQYAIILRQAGRLSRLVSDLTEVSHIVRGQLQLHLELIDLRTVVEHALESSRPYIDEAGHTLKTSVPREPVYVRGDAERLEQVVSNLLNNAARYTDPGGEIRVEVASDGEQALVRVSDNGRGIAPEMLPRVFDQYLQLDPQASASRAGLGLGLTLVRHLVEAHHGTVSADSAGPGLGSEFAVRLPLVGREPKASVQGAARQPG